MAYDRNADFEELCERIDSHCFTGDTLFDPKMIEMFEDYVGRWTRAIASQKETNKEVAEQEANDEKTKADIRETGRIPANALCPFRYECDNCPCNGNEPHQESYSCAMARGMIL